MFQLPPIRPAGLGITVSIKFRSFTPDPTLRFQKFLRPSEKLLSMTIDRPGETWLQKEITPVCISSIIFIVVITISSVTIVNIINVVMNENSKFDVQGKMQISMSFFSTSFQ